MKKKIRVAIIHFQPLEVLPPAMNMIDFISKDEELDIKVFTNKNKHNQLNVYQNENVKIFRIAGLNKSGIIQYVNYLKYYLTTLIHLFIFRPKVVVYIETLSSWPAIVYKNMSGSKVKLMVHYHEYTEPSLYETGMYLSRKFHKIEKRNYKKYSWISHTNEERMEMFRKDCNLQSFQEKIFYTMPNYPSSKWYYNHASKVTDPGIYKLVFVGSLGYNNMYLQELLDWLSKHRDKFSLDIYSYNIDAAAKKAIMESHLSNIRFFNGVDYFELPKILKNYNIGLVIYKPFSLNTVHAVSNKVFEYLACGLDVWFSDDMTYTFNYIKQDSFPKVIAVNFKDLQNFDFQKALSREGLKFLSTEYYFENIYPVFLNSIKK